MISFLFYTSVVKAAAVVPPEDLLPSSIWKNMTAVEGDFITKFQAWKPLAEEQAITTYAIFNPVTWSYKQGVQGMLYEVNYSLGETDYLAAMIIEFTADPTVQANEAVKIMYLKPYTDVAPPTPPTR